MTLQVGAPVRIYVNPAVSASYSLLNGKGFITSIVVDSAFPYNVQPEGHKHSFAFAEDEITLDAQVSTECAMRSEFPDPKISLASINDALLEFREGSISLSGFVLNTEKLLEEAGYRARE